jgi:EAL domain-containing protein (putative c-di-GMP-specific phosphodiesterase class I)
MIENQDMENFAKDIGIDYIQGKFIASLDKIKKD